MAEDQSVEACIADLHDRFVERYGVCNHSGVVPECRFYVTGTMEALDEMEEGSAPVEAG